MHKAVLLVNARLSILAWCKKRYARHRVIRSPGAGLPGKLDRDNISELAEKLFHAVLVHVLSCSMLKHSVAL